MTAAERFRSQAGGDRQLQVRKQARANSAEHEEPTVAYMKARGSSWNAYTVPIGTSARSAMSQRTRVERRVMSRGSASSPMTIRG